MSDGALRGLAAGDAVGPFRILRRLGEGSSGAVYLASDDRDTGVVALKLMALQGTGAAADEARSRFAASAAAARRLAHPAIAAVLDAGADAGLAWVAMEVAPGVPLERYTRPARLLPEPLVLHIARHVAEALAHAHAAGVVHRDMKPANVIVDLPMRSVKVVDFGLARLAEAERTRTGLVLGSPAYMAPEQLAGAEPAPAGDLYALGVMLFQLLAGRLPHDADSLGDLLRQVAGQPAPDLRTLRPDVAPALAGIVAGLLAKRSAERLADAATLAGVLARLADAAAAAGAGVKSRS